MASKKVGTLIKEARVNADLTQEQLARKISGLSASDISMAERGKRNLREKDFFLKRCENQLYGHFANYSVTLPQIRIPLDNSSYHCLPFLRLVDRSFTITLRTLSTSFPVSPSTGLTILLISLIV